MRRSAWSTTCPRATHEGVYGPDLSRDLSGGIMDNPRADKVAVVNEVRERLEASDGAVLTEYRGLTVAELADIAGAFNRHGFGALGPVFEALGGKVDYGRLRIFRAMVNARGKTN